MTSREIHEAANIYATELAQKYLKSDDEAERVCGHWLKYELIYDYKPKDVSLRPSGTIAEALNKLTEEKRNCLINDVAEHCRILGKNLIEQEREEKTYLKVFTGDDEKDIQAVFRVIFNQADSRKKRRKLKIKSVPWNKLPDTLAPVEIFVELITNLGKKVAKKSSEGWIDKNGDKLECKIIKWRKISEAK